MTFPTRRYPEAEDISFIEDEIESTTLYNLIKQINTIGGGTI